MMNMKDKKKETPIRKFLKGIRTEEKETLSAMAARLGCTKQHLSRVESGERKLSEEIIEKIAKEYKLEEEKKEELVVSAKSSPATCLVDISELSYEKREMIIRIARGKGD